MRCCRTPIPVPLLLLLMSQLAAACIAFPSQMTSLHTPQPDRANTATLLVPSPSSGRVLPSATSTPAATHAIPTSISLPGGSGGRIAFVHQAQSGSSYDEDIYVVNLNGTGLMNLTESMDANHFDYPSWSPDGTTLAFHANASDGPGIFLLNSNGTGLARLTDGPGLHTQPTWSPDGSMIAFRKSHLSEKYWQWHLVVISSDGTGERIVASDFGDQGAPTWTTISWSPDSKAIAFTMWADNSSQVFLVNADGTGLAQLTFPEAYARDYSWEPSWSPDGRLIAFSRATGIFTVPPYGSRVSQLILPGRSAQLAFPGWSPDGMRIVAYSESGLYRLTLSALYPEKLSDTWPNCAALSPDASMISYLSPIGDTGVSALVVTDLESLASRELTEFSPVSLGCPVWQP